jgi:uncharacterized membrane protein YbhN (UPF0104 family)
MKINKFLQYAILIAALILIYWYLSKNPNLFIHLERVTLSDFLILLFLRFLLLLINGFTLKAYAAKYMVNLHTREWVGLSFVTALGNYISPFSGGMLFRAGYLKIKHHLSLTKFTILLISNYMLFFWCVALTGFTSSMYLINQKVYTPWQVPFFFGIITLFLMTIKYIQVPEFSSRLWIIKKFSEATSGLKILIQDKRLLTRIIFYTFLNILANGLSFYVAYRSIGIDILFTQAILISMISVFSLIINITPANIGVHEGMVSFASSTLKVGGGEGLIVALIIRAITMILVFTIGPFFLYNLSKKFS